MDFLIINNDSERQPRIHRGQIDTIDQSSEKWKEPSHATGKDVSELDLEN